MKHWIVLLAALLAPVQGFAASALETAARSMSAGQWLQFTSPTGMVSTFAGTGGASGFAIGFVDKFVWDHVTHKGYFIGSDHHPSPAVAVFAVYDEATNAWSKLTPPAWSPDLTNTPMHGYHHTAIDVIGRKLYHRPYNSNTSHVMDLDTQVWSDLPALTTGGGSNQIGYQASGAGVDFFPWIGDKGWLIFHSTENGTNGTAVRYDPVANNWATPTGWNETMTTGDPHNIVECSPVHRLCIAGGGNGSSNVHRITARETMTANFCNAPKAYGVNTSITTHDPVTGNFLFFWDSNDWYEMNPITCTWTQQGGTASPLASPLHTPATPVHGNMAAAIYDYGIIMFAKCWSSTQCTTWLYKHTDSDAATGNFYTQRCLAPGTIMCHGYDSPAEFTGSTREGTAYIDTTGASTPTRSTSTKASGMSSVFMTVPSNSPANSSGSIHDNFRDNQTQQKTAGDTFYVSWRQRWNCDFLFTSCPAGTGNRTYQLLTGSGGWKQIIVGSGERPGVARFSCTDLETVVQNVNQRGLPTMYRSCSGPFAFNPLDEPFNGGSNFYWQNNNRATNSSGCFYPSTTGGCFKYVANEWLSFMIQVKVSNPWFNTGGTFVHNGIVRLYAARDGDTSWTLLIDFSQKGNSTCDNTQTYIPSCQTGLDFWRATSGTEALDTFGQVWLLPYHTGKDPAETHPVGNIWYDDLVVGTNAFPVPGQASSGGGGGSPKVFLPIKADIEAPFRTVYNDPYMDQIMFRVPTPSGRL